jgi:tRNA threonylcarbamoyladenosine biosynthesis protein TsaE
MVTSISHSPAETEALGELWGCHAASGLVIGLTGELGAGKTQLAKGVARGLGVTERVHSPSFVLVNEYRSGRLPLFHLDLFRLDTPAQVSHAGLEEYLFHPHGITVVEWFEHWFTQQTIPVPSPLTINHQPSTIPHQPSTIPHQPLTINHQPLTINHQPLTINHQPSPINHPQSAIGNRQSHYRWVRLEVLSELVRRISYEDFA